MTSMGRQRHLATLSGLAVVSWSWSCAAPDAPAPVAAPIARREDPRVYLPPPIDGVARSGSTLGITAVVPQDDVRSAALTFLRAFIAEDIETLMGFVGESFALGTSGRVLPAQVIREAWQRQFALLDYTQFTVEEVLEHYGIEVVSFEESGSGVDRSQWLRPGDILVRFRMRITSRNRRRYFEDPMELWFRHVGGRWRIVAVGR